MPMRIFRTSRISVNPAQIAAPFSEIGIKTCATASSYVFLQQELARGLRLSQPSRVAKDAAPGELLGLHHRLCVASSPAAHEAAAAAAPARQSVRDATRDCCRRLHTREAPSPQGSPLAHPFRPAGRRTTTWADLPEKEEAKDAAAAAASAAAEMDAGAAGAVRAGVER